MTRSILESVGVVLVCAGVYLNWGLAWALLVAGILVLIASFLSGLVATSRPGGSS